MTTIHRRVIVRELDKGWEASDLHYGTARKYKTAHGVLSAIKRHDRTHAQNGVSHFTTIEWLCASEVGRAVVLSLQEDKP